MDITKTKKKIENLSDIGNTLGSIAVYVELIGVAFLIAGRVFIGRAQKYENNLRNERKVSRK